MSVTHCYDGFEYAVYDMFDAQQHCYEAFSSGLAQHSLLEARGGAASEDAAAAVSSGGDSAKRPRLEAAYDAFEALSSSSYGVAVNLSHLGLRAYHAIDPHDGDDDDGDDGDDDDENEAARESATADDERADGDATDTRVDWNAELQQLLEMPALTPEAGQERRQRIEDLIARFVATQAKVVQTIVDESFAQLADDQRTVRPLNIGGVAGGQKFEKDGVIFKFARDSASIYGGDGNAAKAAKREIRGLIAMMEEGVPGLHFPLQAVFNYMGQRVIAVARAPISAATLQYGSGDGGMTVHSHPSFATSMRELAARLYLKPHQVRGVEVCFAGDVEGHQGLDGRRYVIDTARTFPPAAPARRLLAILLPAGDEQPPHYVELDAGNVAIEASQHLHASLDQLVVYPACAPQLLLIGVQNQSDAVPNRVAQQVAATSSSVTGNCLLVAVPPKAAHLIHLLRPELLRRAKTPLSADAFSGWGRQDHEVHNAEVERVTQYLIDECIPEALAAVESLWDTGSEHEPSLAEIEAVVHQHGVNFRLLGNLRAQCGNAEIRHALLAIMIARSFCKLAEAHLRTLLMSGAKADDVAVDRLLQLFRMHLTYQSEALAQTSVQDTAMRMQLKARLHAKFPGGLTEAELAENVDVWRSLPESVRFRAFLHAQKLLGLKMHFATVAMSSDHSTADGGVQALEMFDIAEIAIRCTKLQPPQLRSTALDNFDLVERTYKEELQIRSQVLPLHHSSVLATQLHLLSIYAIRGDTYERARAIYQQAMEAVAAIEANEGEDLDPLLMQQKAVIALQWANYLVHQGRFDQALGSAYGALGALDELVRSGERQLQHLLWDAVQTVCIVLRELGQYGACLQTTGVLLDELQDISAPTVNDQLRLAEAVTEYLFLQVAIGRVDSKFHMYSHEVFNKYTQAHHQGASYAKAMVADALGRLQEELVQPALTPLQTALGTFVRKLSSKHLTTAETHYWCGHTHLQLRRHVDALVHFEAATMVLEELHLNTFYHQAPLLVEYADCLLQLTSVLDQTEGTERELAMRATNSTVEQLLQDDEELRARFDAVVRSDHKQQTAVELLSAVRLACQDAQTLDPAPRTIRAVLRCADLWLGLGDKQASAELLHTVATLVAAMDVVLGGGSDAEGGCEEDRERNAESDDGPRTIANGDPRVYLELATRLLRDGGDENLAQALHLAKRAHRLLGQLSGPDNKFTQAAEQLVEEIAVEQVLQPLLELGFRHDLCVEAVRAANLDVEAAKLLLQDPDRLHAAVAESKYARTDSERMTWLLTMRTYYPGSFKAAQTLLERIVSRSDDTSLCAVNLSSVDGHTHIAQVKEAIQLLEAVGFDRRALEGDNGQTSLVLDVPHLPVLRQALDELAEVAALPTHETFIRLAYRMNPNYAAGKAAIEAACLQLYPDQANVMQLTATVKFWLGGRDPLDYVSCYSRRPDPQNAVPWHWHYVSFGFSDLFGDGRSFHPECTSSDGPSGFGYELTFRLAKLPGEEFAPSWPSDVMNTLGRYFLATGARVAAGHNLQHMLKDHCPAKHLVVVEDPELGTINTPHGTVQFLQLVAITDEDLDMVQAWNSVDFTDLMRRELDTGGPLLVTDRTRSSSVLDLHPDWRVLVNQGIAQDGSSCAHSTGLLSFLPRYPRHVEGAPAVQFVEELQLMVDKHSAQSLCMALRGRIPHGRGFALENEAVGEGSAFAGRGILGSRVLLVTAGVQYFPDWEGVFVEETAPYALLSGGVSAQVFLTAAQAGTIADVLEQRVFAADAVLPRTLAFPSIFPGFTILVDSEESLRARDGLPASADDLAQFAVSAI